jgi:Holliday junction resolvase
MTPERKVKEKVVNTLKKMGCYYCTPMTGGFGNSGVPDILVCYKGKFIGIECKANNGKLTALQTDNLHRISANSGIALVINESNADVVRQLIEALVSS